ncbi:flagellar hook-basal body protein [Paenibacillus sp. J22TS3]|uniref:flagellar hook-basal body protein n=1 Tax=Paenibacillus sp. J22TS3 TaxID=2807192 RepID=UPI001B108683|nr:flagellar hook-basal body protein [Paenibacillus sp. J22TS3]GIP21789.1 flagellar basal-body rod protein FlgG [Paenibacillus sp. J22TS3]
MNNSMISSAVSMAGIQQRLDVLADNIANVNTIGYKSKGATFEDTLTTMFKQEPPMGRTGRATPLGINVGYGSKMAGITRDFSQGSFKDTGIDTDLAIQGNGLFAVQANGQKAWTREGSFHIQPDPQDSKLAYLVTAQGYYVLDKNNAPITVPAGSKLQIDAGGNIKATLGRTTTNLGQAIQLVSPQRPDALEQRADNLYVLSAGAAERDVLANNDALPQNQRATLRQGALEQSNVDITTEMSDMLQVQRAYQLAARALTSSDTMTGLVNNLRG